MDYSLYDIILKSTIRRHLLLFVVLITLLTLVLFLNIILYKSTTKKLNHARQKNHVQELSRRRDRLLVALVAAALCIPLCGLLGYFRVADMQRDLGKHQYVVVETAYDRPRHQNSVTNDGIVYIELNEKRVKMYLPSDGGTETFPFGEHYGYVCYAEESKVILSFQITGIGGD